jgi:hypothetical protein
MRAAVRSLSSSAVLSDDSAAYLHGLWTPTPPTSVVHVTVPGQADRNDAGVRVHASRLPESCVTEVRGLRVTTVARTAVDLARGEDLPRALVAVDGAFRRLVRERVPGADAQLRERAVPLRVLEAVREQLYDAFTVVWSWPGSRVVRSAIELAEPASESPLESWSRGWIVRAGLPWPEVNGAVFGHSGHRYFGDFVWLRAASSVRRTGWRSTGSRRGLFVTGFGRSVRARLILRRPAGASCAGSPESPEPWSLRASLALSPSRRELLPESPSWGRETGDSGSNSRSWQGARMAG